MPSILILTPTLVSYRVFLRQLAERLVQNGWQVHIACSSKTYPGDHAGDDVASIHEVDFPRGINPWSYFRVARQINRLVSQLKPDLVHAHLQPGVLAAALGRQKNWPVTLGTFQGLVHTTMPPGFRRWLYGMAERWASRRLQAVWVLTEDDFRALPFPNVKLQSSPGFGADQRIFDPARFTVEDRLRRRRELGIPADAIVFVYVGRQTNFKGFPETAQAAWTITQARDDVHFILVGTADPRHPDGLDATQRQQLHQTERIHLLGWDDDVASLLHASDCFVFPSSREGMAVCIMESLSMGVPVVTTSSRGCGELVQDGHNGWIVDRDARRLAELLRTICQHPEQREQRARTALAERPRFSRERYIEEQLDIYDQVLKQAGVEGMTKD